MKRISLFQHSQSPQPSQWDHSRRCRWPHPPEGGAHGAAVRSSLVLSRTNYTFAENVSEYYGEVTCHGIHIVSSKYPAGKDIETCEAVSGKLLHMVAGKGQKEFENASGGHVSEWLSDYNRSSQTSDYSYSVNKKLTKFKIVAIY